MIPKSKMPHFFYDDGMDSHEAEIMLDYFLSWTIRCASDYEDENKLVQKYSKKVLFKILEHNLYNISSEDIEVIRVDTWKQWGNIDLLAEIELKINEATQKYVIVFENKLYTNVHDNQLIKYKETVCEEYKDKPEYEKVYVFLTCFEEVPEKDIKACKKAGYLYYAFQELRDSFDGDETGNYLFDEFWFRYFFNSDEAIL